MMRLPPPSPPPHPDPGFSRALWHALIASALLWAIGFAAATAIYQAVN